MPLVRCACRSLCSHAARVLLLTVLFDEVRTTVLFDDAYELVAFVELMQRRFEVVRLKNKLYGCDLTKAEFRNVHTNTAFTHRGRRLVVEAQLHLRALYTVTKVTHGIYEVLRAVEPHEACGPPLHPFKWEKAGRASHLPGYTLLRGQAQAQAAKLMELVEEAPRAGTKRAKVSPTARHSLDGMPVQDEGAE